MRNLRNLW